MSLASLALGRAVEVTGVEDDPGGGLRVFVGPRYRHTYFVPHPSDENAVLRNWSAAYTSHWGIDPEQAFGLWPHASMPGHDQGFHVRRAIK